MSIKTREPEGFGIDASPLEFWWRPLAGFELRGLPAVDPAGAWLLARPVKPGQPFVKQLRGRVSEATLRAFAELATPDEVRTFADRQGWLGRSQQVRHPETGRQLQGEPVALWLDEAAAIRRILKLFELAHSLTRPNPPELDRRTLLALLPEHRWETIHRRHASGRRGSVPAEQERAWSTRPSRDLAMRATELAVSNVEGKVAQAVSFRLEPELSGKPGRLSLKPKGLLGALYLRLARHIAGINSPDKSCPVCHKPFLASRRQTYCSHACAALASYHRRKSGRES